MESDGLTSEAGSEPYLPGHMVLTDPRLLDVIAVECVAHAIGRRVTKRFFMEDQRDEVGFDPRRRP